MVKKLLTIAAVILGVYFLLHNPQGAAAAAQSGGHVVGATVNALTTFLNSVAK
jgi:hypothetical protein